MADGARRAEIKKADGIKQARILEAEREAQAIKLVNEAANQYLIRSNPNPHLESGISKILPPICS